MEATQGLPRGTVREVSVRRGGLRRCHGQPLVRLPAPQARADGGQLLADLAEGRGAYSRAGARAAAAVQAPLHHRTTSLVEASSRPSRILPLSHRLGDVRAAERRGRPSRSCGAAPRSYVTRRSRPQARDYEIGCIVLEDPLFPEEARWIPAPADFSKNIVVGKGYDLTTPEGAKLWGAVRAARAFGSRQVRSLSGADVWR